MPILSKECYFYRGIAIKALIFNYCRNIFTTTNKDICSQIPYNKNITLRERNYYICMCVLSGIIIKDVHFSPLSLVDFCSLYKKLEDVCNTK